MLPPPSITNLNESIVVDRPFKIKCGCWVLVILSLSSKPVSSVVNKSGTLGTLGGIVSILTNVVVASSLQLPATSFALAVTL